MSFKSKRSYFKQS